MSKKDTEPDLIDLLAKASAADLAKLDARIADKESELAAVAARIGGELESLKSLRKVIDVKLNGKPARKKPERKAKSAAATTFTQPSENGTVRDRIYDYLSKQDRPVRPALIAVAVGCSEPSAYAAVKHEWFRKTPDGYEIART